MKNIAFIDGQNLYMGTRTGSGPWVVDLFRFRRYLKEKYHVERAYYFLGFVNEARQDLYSRIQEAGFILVFKQHNPAMQGEKKGNVDTDIVFTAMKKLYKKEDFDRVVLVSGDGDYKILVDFLIEEKRFEKILFPNQQRASSLYRKLEARYFDHLGSSDIRKKIERK
ncbi:MAG: hypothetical protein UY81_C0003G0007 [Candidatus Giovannonibacteria bacterium GW2011_GWA2_53_7]|uniref:NYN domain-containing protein n=1 Tax=Candidatus Giovannonibacteria bacterium GW2011_GWA2_53_7 TaxID=1618650 RepID=A0A0G2A885_9BACT|nr:MAG: hypothetical protein UY81_C0003G0007 [Candidatus Giovannonibacteria bacterium GW2011_GWA2_53_7]